MRVAGGTGVCFFVNGNAPGNSLSYIGNIRVWGKRIEGAWWIQAAVDPLEIEPRGPYPDRESVLAALRVLAK